MHWWFDKSFTCWAWKYEIVVFQNDVDLSKNDLKQPGVKYSTYNGPLELSLGMELDDLVNGHACYKKENQGKGLISHEIWLIKPIF